jgi:DNA-binding response OmpR family regulator
LARPKVLIIEPRKALREQLRDVLEETFDVLVAQTASGAVTGLNRQRPPAVLISMGQNEGHGLELASKLRDQGVGAPPFIVVYGQDEAAPVLEADANLKALFGVDRYIASGVTIKKLELILTERFRAGWKASKLDVGPATPESKGWTNPMLGTDAMSARKAPDPDKKGFSLRRLFGR